MSMGGAKVAHPIHAEEIKSYNGGLYHDQKMKLNDSDVAAIVSDNGICSLRLPSACATYCLTTGPYISPMFLICTPYDLLITLKKKI
jgi:hypothetical protein